jgi:hypothetical protein
MNTSLKTSKSSSTTVALNVVPESELPVNPGEVTMATGKSPEPIRGHVRAMRPMRFSIGAMISATGIGMILSVAFGMFQIRKFGGDMSLLIVGFVVLLGVMFLGGGFGVMATSSAGFDESEFDRLSTAGNLCAEYDSMFAADKNPDDGFTVTQPVNEGDSSFDESPSGCVTSESEAA